MNAFRISFVFLGLLAALPAQESIPTASLPSSLQNPVDLLADYATVQREPDALWGLGRHYSARFHDDRVEFVPHLPSSPVMQSVVLQATTVGRGSAQARFVRATGAVEQGLRVSYVHEQATEVYEVRPNGLKQSFVFAQLPAGEGDLVVRCRLTTQLPLHEQQADSVTFRNEHGEVRIAGVVGIDAAGNTATGSLTVLDDVLTLRLPAAFVQSASLPLELDPLINSVAYGPEPDIREIRAAYDTTTATYFVAWGSSWFGTVSEVRGLLVPGGPVLIDSAAVNRNISVANNNMRDCFVVTWDTPRPTPFLGTMDWLRVRALRPGQLGTAADFFSSQGPSFSGAAIASTAGTTDSRMLMVSLVGGPYFGGTPGSRTANLLTFDVGPNLAVYSSAQSTLVSSSGASAWACGISRTDGGQDRYLVAVGQAAPLAAHHVICRVFDRNHNTHSNVDSMSTPGLDEALSFTIDGTPSEWFVGGISFLTQFGQRKPWRSRATLYQGGLHIDPMTLLGASTGTFGLDVVMTNRFHAAAFQVVTPFSHACQSNCWSAGISTFTRHDCLTCKFGEYVTQAATFAFARPAANGATSASLASAVKVFYGNTTLNAADFVPHEALVTDLGGGCGNFTGTAATSCGRISAMLESSLVNPSQTTFLLLSADRLDSSGCGTCTLVPNLWTGLIVPVNNPSPTGVFTHQLTIPDTSALVGLSLYEQWLELSATATGCPSFGLNLSNAVRIQLQ